MDRLRPYLEEVTRAVLVLALILFNLAHLPAPAVAYDGFRFISATAIYCGSPDSDDQGVHAPCHACRIGDDSILPPPPCSLIAISIAAVAVIYDTISQSPQGSLLATANRIRGPPTLPERL